MKTVPPSLLAGLTFSLAAVLLSVASCGRPEFPISVQKTRVGLQSDVQPGERLATRRVAQSDYIGAKPGFYALRTKYDFEFFRSDLPKSRALPPKGVSFGDEMVLAGYAEPSSQADKLEIQAVVDNGSQLHVYATQFTPGDECPPAQPGVAFDMVAIPKVERPIAVHLDTGRSPPCKVVGPKAHAVCRVQQTVNWLARLSAPWQSTIECEGLSDQGARPVIDRSWFIGELAKGSTAKLTLSRSGQRVTFPIDALGKFTIKLEATDDEGRRGESVAEVNSVPPSDDTFVQFGWSAFGSTDDIETFPRIEPRVMDVGPKGTLSREACSVRPSRTDTPLQALALMNDVTFVEAARCIAQRVLREAETTDARVTLTFRLLLARAPKPAELQLLTADLNDHLMRFRADAKAASALSRAGEAPVDATLDPAQLAAYTALAGLIFNLDEAITKQ